MSSLVTKSLKEIRRDLHAHPESGWKEFRTTALIAEELDTRGFTVHLGPEAVNAKGRLGVPDDDELAAAAERARKEGAPEPYLERMDGITGLVAVKSFGDGTGPTVGIRTDIDALERNESSSEDHRPVDEGFASTHPNEMHACGHDAHATIGLGLARELDENGGFDGTLKLFFQPAEEGGRGGKPMSETEHLEDVDYFVAVHVGLGLETGVVCAARDRPLSNAKFDVVFAGEGAHAGHSPQEGRNALVAAATAILNLQAIPRHGEGGTRINVGHVHSPNPQNIIPEYVEMRVEVRGETSELCEYMEEYVKRIVEHAGGMHDVDVSTELYGKTVSFAVDQKIAEIVASAAADVESVSDVIDHTRISGSEDASYLIREVQANGGKATYIGIGASNPYGHHHPKFDIDEESIEIGIDTLATVIRSV